MAVTFDELGLREELVDALEEADFPRPTELQAAAVPVLRRGNNAVLHASAGAGVVAAWGLALLDRLAGEELEEDEDGGVPVRALVLAPTEHAAARAAAQLAPFASATGLRVLAVAAGWAPAGGVADVVLATPEAALEAVSASRLKLSEVRALVLSDADLLLKQAASTLDTLTAAVPADAQRVVVAGEPAAARDYVDRHVRKALQIPRIDEQEAGEATGVLAYVVTPERDRLETLARLVDESTGPPLLVFCRTDERAAQVADGLAARGFGVGPAGEEGVDVAVVAASAEEVDVEGHLPCSYDVPSGPDEMRARHAAGGLVLVAARELPHLERTAARVGLSIRARREPLSASRERDAEAHRDRIRKAADEEDLSAQLLLLEPLFAEMSAAEVAAAASALLRRTPPAAPARHAAAAPSARAEAPAAAAPPAPGMRTRAPAPGASEWTRLFISVGLRDGARPGDLVGAITGEARIGGDRVGKVDIRDTFSLVEVASADAEKVILGLNGTTLKGRSVRVDYHRERTGPAPDRSGGAPRPRPSGGAPRGGGGPPRSGGGGPRPGGGGRPAGGSRSGGAPAGGGSSRGGGGPRRGGAPGGGGSRGGPPGRGGGTGAGGSRGGGAGRPGGEGPPRRGDDRGTGSRPRRDEG